MKYISILILCLTSFTSLKAQETIAQTWTEHLLFAVKNDFARPTVHARNLFHVSVAMYDAWAIYDEKADTYLMGKEIENYSNPFYGFAPNDINTHSIALSIGLIFAKYSTKKLVK